jgi:hypothetical protein
MVFLEFQILLQPPNLRQLINSALGHTEADTPVAEISNAATVLKPLIGIFNLHPMDDLCDRFTTCGLICRQGDSASFQRRGTDQGPV